MIAYLLALILLLLAVTAVSIRKTLRLHSPVELKRRARAHDSVARRLYPVVAYGPALQLLLWGLIVIPLAGSFALFRLVAPPVLVFVVMVLALGYAFAWVPSNRTSGRSVHVAVQLAPALLWLLRHSAPALHKLHGWIGGVHQPHQHTRLYEHDDIIDLLETQKAQSDNRIPAHTLDAMSHVLQFDQLHVRDIVVPRSQCRLVSPDDQVGPLLMKELHDSGFQRFPVFDSVAERVVGVLDLHVITDLKHDGPVRGAMDERVQYLHLDHPLEQVLDAFYKTGAHLLIVTNDRSEFVGLITVEDVLSRMLGYRIAGDFDQYDSLAAVSGYQAAAPVVTETDDSAVPA